MRLPPSTAASAEQDASKTCGPDALVSSVPAEFDVVEDNDPDVIRTKQSCGRFSMTSDEVVFLQMNLLAPLFYVFRNGKRTTPRGHHCNNGGGGLIETEE